MTPVFSDFETFWSQEHTLKKMNPVVYVMHPETELIAWSIKVGNAPTDVIFGEKEIKRVAARLDWSDYFVISHNGSAFDHMIHAWRLGIRPKMWGCTQAMARPIHAKDPGLSLAKLVLHYAAQLQAMGIKPRKEDAILHSTRGKHLCDFTPDEIRAMEIYNKDDTEQCRGLFRLLLPHYNSDELWHIDANIRMLVEPEFELDTALLEVAQSVNRSNKHKALLTLASLLTQDGLDRSDEDTVAEWVRTQMASADKFAAILTSRGVDVPMKRSKTNPEKKIPALAKTDEAMAELLEDEDEVVAAAAAARLSVKSTQLDTRITAFLDTYEAAGKLPVPAHYCGADTTGRDSGFIYNMYNLPRITPGKPKVSDALRNAVRAPAGKVIGVADLSGIELRVNHTLWKVARSMANWRAKPDYDLYRDTAADMYTIRPEDVEKPQRQYAKVIELACGFQQGAKTFRQTARVQGGLHLTLAQAKHGVDFWRGRYPEISDYRKGGWAKCHDALEYIARGDKKPIDPWGLCTTEKDAILLPSGRRIRYPELRQELVKKYVEVDGILTVKEELSWVYGRGRHYAFIYGGKVDENIVQALARDIIFPNAIAFWKQTKLRPKHKVYDEMVYLFDPAVAQEQLDLLQSIMRTPPKWWPDLTLWSEGDIADTYGAAK